VNGALRPLKELFHIASEQPTVKINALIYGSVCSA